MRKRCQLINVDVDVDYTSVVWPGWGRGQFVRLPFPTVTA